MDRKWLLILIILAGAANHFFVPDVGVPTVKEMWVRSQAGPPSEGELLAQVEHPTVTELSGIKGIDGTAPGIRADDLAQPGLFTIVVFDSPECPACHRLYDALNMFFKIRPDVAIRQVHMPKKWSRRWARAAYGLEIGGTPHVHVYNPHRELIGQDIGRDRAGYKLLADWVNAEFRLEHERRGRERK
jgi:hypothetical protein